MTPVWAIGMRRIISGVYLDGATLHIDTQCVCAWMGVEWSAEAREIVREAIAETLADMGEQFELRMTVVEHGAGAPN
jgi:hypothetical protein